MLFSRGFSRTCLEGISFKFFVCFIFNVSLGSVALSSEHQPKTPAYASKQKSKKSSGIYISSKQILHINNIRIGLIEICTRTYQRDSCMKGLGSARRRSWGSLTTHLQVVCKPAAKGEQSLTFKETPRTSC